ASAQLPWSIRGLLTCLRSSFVRESGSKSVVILIPCSSSGKNWMGTLRAANVTENQGSVYHFFVSGNAFGGAKWLLTYGSARAMGWTHDALCVRPRSRFGRRGGHTGPPLHFRG